MTPAPRRAAVIGASMAGLLAARVLAEHFDEVVLLERDAPGDAPALRKGTPQAAHAHGLLARGREIIEQLLPGFTAALLAQGATRGDIGCQAGLLADRRRFAPAEVGVDGIAASRPLIEAELRRRVLALPGVRLLAGIDVTEPVHAAGRVLGLRWLRRDGAADGAAQQLDAALVLDCSGRASRSPQWLQSWGYEAPVEERVVVKVSYATAYFERRPGEADDLRALIATASPALQRPGVLIAQEPERPGGPPRWVVTLAGYGADVPPLQVAALRERALDMGAPEIAAICAADRRLGAVQRYAFPHSQRRRYERLRRFPAGYAVLGDALTSFNPVYGQGMTVAACEALALQQQLRRLARGRDLDWRRFFVDAARVIDTPWQLAVGADLALPCVEGPRPLPLRLVNAYVGRLMRAATRDAVLSAAFARVMHLLARPETLFAPPLAWRVWRHGGAELAPPSATAAAAGKAWRERGV